jgi:hypothetical protein
MSKIALSLALVLAAASAAVAAPKHHHRGVPVQPTGTEAIGRSAYGYPTGYPTPFNVPHSSSGYSWPTPTCGNGLCP